MLLLLATLSSAVISFCPGKFLIKAAFLNEIPLKEMKKKKNERIATGSAPRLLRRQPLTRAGRFHDYKLTDALQQPQVFPRQLPAGSAQVPAGRCHPLAATSLPASGKPFCPQATSPRPRGCCRHVRHRRAVMSAGLAHRETRASLRAQLRRSRGFGKAPVRFPGVHQEKGGPGDERWLLSLSLPPPPNS